MTQSLNGLSTAIQEAWNTLVGHGMGTISPALRNRCDTYPSILGRWLSAEMYMNAPAQARSALARVFAIGWNYRGLFLLSLGISALSGAVLGYLLLVIDRLVRSWAAVQSSLDRGGSASQNELEHARSLMGGTVWELIALAPIAALMAYLSIYCGLRLANACMRDLRQRFVVHLVELDLGFHARAAKGDLMARMMADLDGVRGMIQRLFGRILTKPPEILALIGYIWYLSWIMGAAALILLIPLTLVLGRIIGRTKRRSRKAREALALNLVTFEQITSGIRVIKAMGSGEREDQRFSTSNDDLYRRQMRVAHTKAQSEAVTNGSVFILFALLLWLAGWLFAQGLAEPASLIAVIAALGRITAVLRELQKGITDLVSQIPAAERMFAILDTPPNLHDDPALPPCPKPQTAITFKKVHFSYDPNDETVLRGIDLEIPVGKTLALVGASGGGKSTLLDLIPRLHDPTNGWVLWDGVDIRGYRPSTVVGHCAIVQQDPFLFDDTVYNNISYGRPEASREEIETAARRANIHDDILRLEGGKGYDTPVGDRGSRLSGGQRQRVVIARALLRDAPVLLLDEPTSALDATSETHVQAALAELMRGRTTIIVAHRLATVRHADRICVLGGKDDGEWRGQLMESGTHDELLARGKAYARLVAQQHLG
ncbi:MAG: ABC transporter ATP-binding protein [Planctomycetota bacterium]|nr:MAG: ABC transporter ATP-binding protein [Planctomycetota bacterium]